MQKCVDKIYLVWYYITNEIIILKFINKWKDDGWKIIEILNLINIIWNYVDVQKVCLMNFKQFLFFFNQIWALERIEIKNGK